MTKKTKKNQCLYTKIFPINIAHVYVYVAEENRITFLGSYCYEILNTLPCQQDH